MIDKSDRGALQENDAFDTFKTIITGVIHEFEFDRTKIFLNEIFIELQKEKKKKEEKEINRRAEELAKKIVADQKKLMKSYSEKVKE